VTLVVVLSDTHAPRRWKSCPPAVAAHLREADMILHAGDVCTAPVLDELARYAPVTAVVGNNDGPDVAAWGAAETASLEIEGLRVGMIHDSGPAAGRLGRMRRRFPEAALVVFGHSHIPLDSSSPAASPVSPASPTSPASSTGEFRIFNPGSPTDRRRQPRGTIGLLRISGGVLVEARIVPVT
jgi:uncharacterized protein